MILPRTGDVLRLSCPSARTRVTEVGQFHVSIKSPWWRIDPESHWIKWNGDLAICRDPSHWEWRLELFRTVPPAPELHPNDPCAVSIPPTVVHVMEVETYDPPRETGWLPRPTASIIVVRYGESQDPRAEFQGSSVDIDDAVSIEWALLYRPYAFLEIGDELADSAGRAWCFASPWAWHAFDETQPSVPAWPLTLLTRSGADVQAAADVVARATATGDHAQVLERWQAHSGAKPPEPLAA